MMRAKLPDREGVIDRNGIRIHYENYGQGDHTIFSIPTWSLVHSRFIGAEALHLLGVEDQGMPVRRSLRRFGDVIRMFEKQGNPEEA